MIAVIFEVHPKPGRAQRYFDLAAEMKPMLQGIDGFVSVERFQSLTTEGKYLSLSLWRDEEAVRAWRTHAGHRTGQQEGRSDVFADYRIRVAEVLRDYGMTEREQAPPDSCAVLI
ncbi:MAG: antibiotic biosynthesis monooxygenase [Burkholderiales bacterium]|nr:antibiotic biosynthesis monooxygenase [Burkholderiales bacterium]